MISDIELFNEYRQWCKSVAQCLELMRDDASKQIAHDMLPQIAEQIIQIARRKGYSVNYNGNLWKRLEYAKQEANEPQSNREQQKPWDKLHISRSTYYRDLRRVKTDEDIT